MPISSQTPAVDPANPLERALALFGAAIAAGDAAM
jgi:hypothetical protein